MGRNVHFLENNVGAAVGHALMPDAEASAVAAGGVGEGRAASESVFGGFVATIHFLFVRRGNGRGGDGMIAGRFLRRLCGYGMRGERAGEERREGGGQGRFDGGKHRGVNVLKREELPVLGHDFPIESRRFLGEFGGKSERCKSLKSRNIAFRSFSFRFT